MLKFSKDKKRWAYWLLEAKRRFKLVVLNYTVTSNHIHLLVYCNDSNVIPQAVQLIAGRTAQEFNNRRNRKGAFWQDRYHATAVESRNHLMECIVYIDLNMVRAGVVNHPSEWKYGGYNEIQDPPLRYRIIHREMLVRLLGHDNETQMKEAHRSWVDVLVEKRAYSRNPVWTESIAYGSKSYVTKIKDKMGYKAIGRSITENPSGFELREIILPYNVSFDAPKGHLRPKNTFIYEEKDMNSVG